MCCHQGVTRANLTLAQLTDSTKQRLLQHLAESDCFSSKDLQPIRHTLDQFKKTVGRNSSTHDLRIIGLLDAKINECLEAIKPLEAKLDRVSPLLAATHEQLVSLRRCMKAAEAGKKVCMCDRIGLGC